MPVNFCKDGFMSTCMASGKGWSVHVACHFSRKSSSSDRCMHCVHGEFCDNHKAQDAVRRPVVVLEELEDLLDKEFDDLEKVEPTQDEYLKHLDEAKEDSDPKIILPDMSNIIKSLKKGGP